MRHPNEYAARAEVLLEEAQHGGHEYAGVKTAQAQVWATLAAAAAQTMSEGEKDQEFVRRHYGGALTGGRN